MELKQFGVMDIGGKRTPVITVTNNGSAHGRMDGALQATDAKGLEFELLPEGTPVLPGQTRNLPLQVRGDEGKPPPEVTLPIKARGTLDWEKGGFRIEAEFK
jgi:hypothetical protein